MKLPKKVKTGEQLMTSLKAWDIPHVEIVIAEENILKMVRKMLKKWKLAHQTIKPTIRLK